MLDCIWNNLAEDGMGLITVPSLEYILKYDGYYELIRDHIAYYTFDTLRYLLENHGFRVLEKELINRDTLSVIVRKGSQGELERLNAGAAMPEKAEEPGKAGEIEGTKESGEIREVEKAGEAEKPEEIRESEKEGETEKTEGTREAEKAGEPGKTGELGEMREPEKTRESARTGKKPKAVDISGLKASLEDIPGQIERLCAQLESQGKTMAMWGAGHQGFTLAATTALKDHARYILDSAPFKQGRFAPASHLPIIAPEEYEKDPVDVIFIAAPGYTDEIAEVIRRRYGGNVEIMALRSDHVEELS